jgi:hypothetical protein
MCSGISGLALRSSVQKSILVIAMGMGFALEVRNNIRSFSMRDKR